MERFKRQRGDSWWKRWLKAVRQRVTLAQVPRLTCEPIAGGGIGG